MVPGKADLATAQVGADWAWSIPGELLAAAAELLVQHARGQRVPAGRARVHPRSGAVHPAAERRLERTGGRLVENVTCLDLCYVPGLHHKDSGRFV